MLEVYRCDFFLYIPTDGTEKGNRDPRGRITRTLQNHDATDCAIYSIEGKEKSEQHPFLSPRRRFIHLSLSMIIRTFSRLRAKRSACPSLPTMFAAAIFCLVDSIVPASEKGEIECQLFLTNDVSTSLFASSSLLWQGSSGCKKCPAFTPSFIHPIHPF